MNDRRVLQRLIWKDIATLRPLVKLALSMIVILNFVIVLFWQADEFDSVASVGQAAIFIWGMVPFVVAFGAPALLVGTDEEAGTANWLRVLPTTWHQISASRLIVAMGSVAIAWIASSLMLWMMSLGWERRHLFLPDEIGWILYYSLLMLLLGFLTSYAVRSPFLSIITLVPLFIVVAILFSILVQFSLVVGDQTVYRLLAAIGVAVVAWGIGRGLAYRRLSLPDRRPWFTWSVPTVPLRSARTIGARPTVIASLLWQQTRQTAPFIAAIVAFSIVMAVGYFRAQSLTRFGFVFFFGSFAPLFMCLGASWLGALSFYGDNMHRRCGFFADRGVSPTQIWWTRLLPPAVGCLLLMISAVVVALATPNQPQNYWMITAIAYGFSFAVLFAFGQLVSQWVDRPLLAFLAAPAYAAVSLVPASYLMVRFNLNPYFLVLCVPVLLFASWQLTSRWLEGRTKASFTVRVLGYTAIAVLIPCMAMFIHSVPGHFLFGELVRRPVTASVRSETIQPPTPVPLVQTP